RMNRREDPDNSYTTWTYDCTPGDGPANNCSIGKLRLEEFFPGGGTNLQQYSKAILYDTLSRPMTETELISGIEYVTTTSYDNYSRPSILTYPNGLQVKQVYSAYNGQEIEIDRLENSNWVLAWKSTAYDADNHVTSEQFGNGIVTNRAYIQKNGFLRTIGSG